MNNSTINYFFIVLGKVEGDKNDENKKNWHGHVTVKVIIIALFVRLLLLHQSPENKDWHVF